MSNIAIQGAATGTGVFTLASPATNTNRTLTLPDEAGTVLTNSSDIPAANLTGSLPAGMGGKVLQVVNGVSGSITTTSNTYVNVTGYSATITPTSASNKILVRCLPKAHVSFNTEVYPITRMQITANGSSVYEKGFYNYAGRAPNGYVEMQIDFNAEFLHSPATTSAITYQVQIKVDSNANITVASYSEIILMEIVG